MKKIISLFLAATAFACTQEQSVDVTVTNPSAIDRSKEVTEISMDAIAKLNGESFIISDNNGTQVPYQITYDKKIIFPVDVNANSSVTYKIEPGTPEEALPRLSPQLPAVSSIRNVWTILPGKTTVSLSVPMVRLCKLPANKLSDMISGLNVFPNRL